jgi:hypothetical protein
MDRYATNAKYTERSGEQKCFRCCPLFWSIEFERREHLVKARAGSGSHRSVSMLYFPQVPIDDGTYSF